MIQGYNRHISFTLIRNMLLAGFVVGLVMVSIRCVRGVEDRAARIDSEMYLLIDAVKGPAAEAAYDLDRILADKAVSGIFDHPAVSEVALVDDFGTVLAGKSRPYSEELPEWISSKVYGWKEYYEIALNWSGEEVGKLEIALDSPAIARDLLREVISSALTDFGGFLVLAAILLAVFHITLTRPLLSVNRELSASDPADSPGRRLTKPKRHERDEIGLLVESVNRLFQRIEEDIQRREIIESDLRKAKEVAEEASRTKSEFLANMSHEVRTPLNAILGMTELTLKSELDGEQRENLEMVFDSGGSLLRIMNDILDISMVDAGIVEVDRKPMEPGKMVEWVVEMFGNEARKKGLELEARVGEDVPAAVLGDAGRIRQILFNLLGNAIKFTEEGRVVVSVERAGEEMAGGVPLKFSVSDTGIGIPERYLDRILQPFTQLDGSYSRRYQGAGLGLSIVSRFVDLLGGRLEVESSVGEGSTFSVILAMPVAAEVPGEEESAEPSGKIDLTGLKVLLAEDNPVNLIYAVKLLQDMGIHVTAVENGADALKTLKREKFDAVVLDIQMPGVDGLAVAKAVRQSRGIEIDPDTPLIAMTAHAMKGDREKFLAAGMNDYLSKPVNADELKRVLSKVLSRKS